MTRRVSARVAGFTFLVYIAAGIASMVLFGQAAGGQGVAARLQAIAQHATEMGLVVILGLLQSLSALVLSVTLYAITREQDADLALLALACRVAEGVVGAAGLSRTLALVRLATTTAADASGEAAAHALGAHLLRGDMALTATFFAVGSALFCYLLLRGRMIPVPLAWLGVVASALLVVVLPLQLAGFLRGPITLVAWLPMLAFEVPFALWLILRGVEPVVDRHRL